MIAWDWAVTALGNRDCAIPEKYKDHLPKNEKSAEWAQYKWLFIIHDRSLNSYIDEN